MQKFSKNERLCNKREIDQLFQRGSIISEKPLSILWKSNNCNNLCNSVTIKVLIVVSKKNIPKAVTRNKIKRLIRESYRKNKKNIIEFLRRKEKNVHLAFIYNESEISNLTIISEKINLLLLRLKKEI